LDDLQIDLTSTPEKEKLPLEELDSALRVGHSSSLSKYAAAASMLSGPATSIENVIESSDVLNIIDVQKKVEEVPLSKCMKKLVGRKSTLQNEHASLRRWHWSWWWY